MGLPGTCASNAAPVGIGNKRATTVKQTCLSFHANALMYNAFSGNIFSSIKKTEANTKIRPCCEYRFDVSLEGTS